MHPTGDEVTNISLWPRSPARGGGAQPLVGEAGVAPDTFHSDDNDDQTPGYKVLSLSEIVSSQLIPDPLV